MHSWILAIAAQGPSSPGPGEYDAEMDRRHRPPAYTIGGRPAFRHATLTHLLTAVCLSCIIKLYSVLAAQHNRALCSGALLCGFSGLQEVSGASCITVGACISIAVTWDTVWVQVSQAVARSREPNVRLAK